MFNNQSDLFRLEEKLNTSEDIFDGNILHVKHDTVILPNGDIGDREVIRHRGAVCVIPVLADNKVIVERQYRYPIARVMTEIPAGKLEKGDTDRLEAAKRELKEETGYEAEEWIELGTYLPAAAYCDENISMYMARNLTKGTRNLDADEFLDVYEVPLSELEEMVMKGEIMDGKTQIAILKAANLLLHK